MISHADTSKGLQMPMRKSYSLQNIPFNISH